MNISRRDGIVKATATPATVVCIPDAKKLIQTTTKPIKKKKMAIKNSLAILCQFILCILSSNSVETSQIVLCHT